MNILPKKRWHVRTKENIARVRRDEAEAAEKEKQEQLRIENADREARLNLLKEQSKHKLEAAGIFTNIDIPETSCALEHVNLFADLDHAVKTTNKEHETEVKSKKEEYEKKIGYLTYLGQDTNEALKKKNWYEVAPEASRFLRSGDIKDTYEKLVLKDEEGKPKTRDCDVKDGEVSWKAKQKLDPLNAFRKYCPEKIKIEPKASKTKEYTSQRNSHKNKKKKNKKDKDSKSKKDKIVKLQKMREARLKRELEERKKTELYLKGPDTEKKKDDSNSKVKPKYNSQFNPEIARQNYK